MEFSTNQRALISSLQDGTVVIERGGLVLDGDQWTDVTIASLVRRGVLVHDARLDQGNRRAYRLNKRFMTAA